MDNPLNDPHRKLRAKAARQEAHYKRECRKAWNAPAGRGFLDRFGRRLDNLRDKAMATALALKLRTTKFADNVYNERKPSEPI